MDLRLLMQSYDNNRVQLRKLVTIFKEMSWSSRGILSAIHILDPLDIIFKEMSCLHYLSHHLYYTDLRVQCNQIVIYTHLTAPKPQTKLPAVAETNGDIDRN
jgi:hypothetical protein